MSEKEIRLLLVEDNYADARLVREMLAAAEGFTFRIHCAATLLEGLDALAHGGFDIALVDLTLPDSQGLATFETIRRQAHGLPIVILTGMSSEQLALNAVQRGAQEYLVKGRLNTQALVRVLQYSLVRFQTMARNSPPEPADTSKITGVLSAKGGVGGTSLACQLSAELKRQTGKQTLLVDLDVSAASAAFLMKSASKYSVADAAANLHRLDADFWKGVVGATPHGVDVLQSPGVLGFSEPVSGELVRHVLRFARTVYSSIVVDLGRLSAQSMNLLEEIDEIYLVSTGGLPEIYEAGRVLKKLLDLGRRREQVRVVFNRMSRTGQPHMSAFQEALGHPVFWVIPDISKELQDAFAEGHFMDERSPLRKHVARLVAQSLGSAEQKRSRSLLDIFRLGKAVKQDVAPVSPGSVSQS
jgi:Flp pilus assembly CpaE family ATPase